MRTAILLAAWLLLTAASPASAEPNAVLVNITEEHLNSVLTGAARSGGWSRISGHQEELSDGVHDFRYEASLSEPVLALGAEGAVRLSFELRQADLRVGRLERRLVRLPLRCENFGLSLDPAKRIDVDLDFTFRIEEGELRLVPDPVSVSRKKKDFRLSKPSACKHALIPKWLLWQLGKPKLRKRVEELDGILQERVDRVAGELNAGRGLLHERIELGEEDLYLSPGWIDTGRGSLLLGLDLSDTGEPTREGARASVTIPRDPRTFVALSESFLNTLLALLVSEMPAGPQRPGGWMTRMVKSNRIYAMFPGLRALESTEGVTFSVRPIPAPRLVLSTADGRARIRILVGEIEVDILRESEWLGTLVVDSGRIEMAPLPSPVGGISLELVENEWSVSARGIEQNSELIAAALQETVFGEIFETIYEPLIPEGLAFGPAAFRPVYFAVDSGYLLVGLSPLETIAPVPQAKR